jgi:cytochrome c-type biogenesis protein CcmH/NrfG
MALPRGGRLPKRWRSCAAPIALRADEPRGHLVLGMALARMFRNDEAAEALCEATRLDPDSADAWMHLARVQLQMGDMEGSLRSRRLANEAAARRALRSGGS